MRSLNVHMLTRSPRAGKLKSNKAVIGGSGSAEGGAAEVLAGLEKEAAESEERSEASARAFVQGDLKLPEFQVEFLRERRKYHERQAKMEKLQQLQQQQQQQAGRR